MSNVNKLKSIVYSISVLSGAIIGVGLFSLPYLTLQVGWLTILIYFAVVGSLVALLHVFFGELVLKTPDHKRLPGIAEYYWGKTGKRFTLFSHISCLLGTMLAYIIIGGGFLHELILSAGINISLISAIIFYLMIGGVVVFFESLAFNKIQFAGIIIFFLAMIGLAFLGWDKISIENIFARHEGTISRFAPYGAIMFSLWGATLIPLIEDILGKNKKYMTRVVLISIALPTLVYLFFIIIILGLTGAETSPSALTSLGGELGRGANMLILLLGLVTTFTSFVAIGLTLMQVLKFDLKISKLKAWLITLLLPLGFYIAGVKNFLEVIIFLGSVLLAIDGVNILFMYRKGLPRAKAWKRFASVVLIIILFGGIAYEIRNLF